MPDLKISGLTALTAADTADLLEIVDVSDTTMAATGTNKKITAGQILASGLPGSFTTITGSGLVKSTTAVHAALDGSDSVGAGAVLGVLNTALNRAWYLQLSASNNLDYWHYNGSWAKYATLSSTGLAVTGAMSATGAITTAGPNTDTTVNNGTSGSDLTLKNTTNTTNTYVATYYAGANGVAAGVGAQITDQTNKYGDLWFLTRSAGGYVEKMRLSSTGTLKTFSTISVGNATPSASGAGITFPATQSASTDPNTLDDYEEGTWTPGVGTLATVGGVSSVVGTYTKGGNQVTVTGYLIAGTSVSASANSYITGLPFIVNATAGGQGVLNNAAMTQTVGIAAAPSNTVLYCAQFSSTAYISFTVTYFV